MLNIMDTFKEVAFPFIQIPRLSEYGVYIINKEIYL